MIVVTKVFNLRTEQYQIFSIDAAYAVICAYEQSRGNNNTWEYTEPRIKDHPLLECGASGRTVFCGDFAAML